MRTHPLLTVPTAITQRDNYQVPLGRLGCWRCSWDSKARKTSGRMLGSQEGCWGRGGLEVPERLNPTGQGWNRSLAKARGASSLPTLCSLPGHRALVPAPFSPWCWQGLFPCCLWLPLPIPSCPVPNLRLSFFTY